MLTRYHINLLHTLAIGPFLAYIGYYRGDAVPEAFTVLLVLAVIVMLYHGMRVMQQLRQE